MMNVDLTGISTNGLSVVISNDNEIDEEPSSLRFDWLSDSRSLRKNWTREFTCFFLAATIFDVRKATHFIRIRASAQNGHKLAKTVDRAKSRGEAGPSLLRTTSLPSNCPPRATAAFMDR